MSCERKLRLSQPWLLYFTRLHRILEVSPCDKQSYIPEKTDTGLPNASVFLDVSARWLFQTIESYYQTSRPRCAGIHRVAETMRRIFRHIKTYIIRGVIASIPLVLTFFVIRFLYLTIDQRIMKMLEDTIGRRIPGLGLLLLLAVIYLFGLIASNVIGRQIFSLIERITKYIPFIKTTYQVGKQISSTLAIPEKEVLKRPVLVEFLKPGL